MAKNLDKATQKCEAYIKKFGLSMKLVDTCYDPKERKITFKFESDRRVDFRELLKMLQQELGVKIELRQVGPRDKAQEIGGIGPCGQECCCKRFMNNFESVSVKLLKKQNLQGNPQRYGGYCGKLMCCLKFEIDDCPKNNNQKTDR